MTLLKQSTIRNRAFKLVSSTDHISAKTGASPTVNLSKDCAAFGAAAGAVTEIANGWYKVALTTVDTNTLGDLAFYITASGADDTDFADQVVVDLPGATVASVTGAVGSVTGAVGSVTGAVGSVTGGVTVTTNNDKTGYSLTAGQLLPAKNAGLNNYEIYLTSSTDHLSPATGATVTATRSIDGAAFGACANSVSEVSNGVYKINFAASDLNGTVITFRFTSPTADTLVLTFLTQP